MGRFDKLPGIDGENTTRRNVLVGTGYAFGGMVVLGSASSDDDDVSEDTTASADTGGDQSTQTESEESEETEEPTANPTEEPTETEQNTTHELGETFEVGSGGKSIRYTVQEVVVADEIGGETMAEEADGRFVIVILNLENTGDESLDITNRNLKLVDSEDREFEADTEASMYLESDSRVDVEAITFDQLQPGLDVERAVIFDVAAGQSYTFKADPAGVFSAAESHYVPIGDVPEE